MTAEENNNDGRLNGPSQAEPVVSALRASVPDAIKCGPRCGSGCKKAAYDQAVAEADGLCTVLGVGWTPRVWENGGWHYSAKNGVATIRPNIVGNPRDGGWTVAGYSAELLSKAEIGLGSFQIIERADCPNNALGFAVQRANSTLSLLRDELSALL